MSTMTPPGTVGPGANATLHGGGAPFAGLRPAPAKGTALAAQALTATANINTYASLPTPLVFTVTRADGPWLCLFDLAAYVDIAANNVEIALPPPWPPARTAKTASTPTPNPPSAPCCPCPTTPSSTGAPPPSN